MSRIEGIIFDCDGVLFESKSANLAYYNRILEKFGYSPVSVAQQQRAHLCHTASSPDVLAALLKEEHLQPALAYAASLDYREFIPQLQPEPFLPEVLEQLALKFPLAVATNRGSSVEPILDYFGLAGFFSAVVTSKDVERPKPAPDMVVLASERLGSVPEMCLFIGDSELDQQAAAGARARFAGYGGIASGEVVLKDHLQLLDYLLPNDRSE